MAAERTEAWQRVGARRRFGLLDEGLRRWACDVYAERRGNGAPHAHAVRWIMQDARVAALPWWGVLLLSLLLRALGHWWQER